MTRVHKELTDSLRFQLSLLRLSVVPHGLPREASGADATMELAKLAEKIPVTGQPRRRARAEG